MVKFYSALIILMLIFGCSREYRILEAIEDGSNNFRLYVIPRTNELSDSLLEKDFSSIKKPLVIEDIKTLQLMKKDWILSESPVPAKKTIKYQLLLYKNTEQIISAWLDEKFKILIWENKLLAFDDSLLFKYEYAFTFLPRYELKTEDAVSARMLSNDIHNAGGLVFSNPERSGLWKKYNGEYKIRREKGDLEPIPQIGKLRQKISDDFFQKEFALIDYEFEPDSDSMTVFIAADSEYVQYLPAAYQVVGEFKKFGPIELSCIGLERRQLEKIAVKNNTSLTILKDAYN